MNKLELISYEEYPDDQYTKAVAIIAIDNEHVVAYAKKKTKDNNYFWAPPSIGVTKNGSKVYIDCYMNNYRIKEKQIQEFIKEKTRMLSQNSVSFQGSISNTPQEAAGNEQLPF